MSWVVLQISSVFLNSLCNILDKRLVNEEKTSVLYLASYACVSLPIAVWGVRTIPHPSIEAIATGIISGLIFTMMVFIYYKAMQMEEVSRLIPVLRLGDCLNLLFFAVFLNDRLSFTQYIAAGLMVTGGFAIAWKKSEEGNGSFYISRGVVWMFVVAFLSAVQALLYGHLVLDYSPMVLVVWSKVGIIIGTVMILLSKTQRFALRRGFLSAKPILSFAIIVEQAVRLVTGILSAFAVKEASSAALVSILEGIRPVIILLLAMVLLGERVSRDNALPKFGGVGLMSVGAIFLMLG